MANRFSVPSLKTGDNRRDVGLTYDNMGEFVADCRTFPPQNQIAASVDSWTDNLGFDATCERASSGDLSRVAASDTLMSKLENLVTLQTAQMATIDAICGGVPNVPAFLAGQPINMRRRQRVMSQAAPLNVIVDLASSASVPSSSLEKRGAAVLAFVRVISAQRPVNLYLGCAFTHRTGDKTINTGAIAVRVDTAPLDLARAAFAISGAAFPRRLLYSALEKEMKCSNSESLPFPYQDNNFYRANLHKFWSRFVSVNDEDTAIVASLYADDKFDDPETWLRDMVKQYAII